MTVIRNKLAGAALIMLASQVAAVALAPLGICCSLAKAATAAEQVAARAVDCPEHGEPGHFCVMAASRRTGSRPSASEAAWRDGCVSPDPASVVPLRLMGVPAARTALAPPLGVVPPAASPTPSILDASRPPTSPPPRA